MEIGLYLTIILLEFTNVNKATLDQLGDRKDQGLNPSEANTVHSLLFFREIV